MRLVRRAESGGVARLLSLSKFLLFSGDPIWAKERFSLLATVWKVSPRTEFSPTFAAKGDPTWCSEMTGSVNVQLEPILQNAFPSLGEHAEGPCRTSRLGCAVCRAGRRGQQARAATQSRAGLVSDDSFRTRRYFPALDGLRCLSIAAVVWHHSTPRPLAGLAGRGHLGVRLFFCISGLLITTLLLREKREQGQIDLLRFWTRRALRIFPLYYGVLALFIAFASTLPPASAMRSHFFASLPYYLSHTSNWFIDFNVKHKVLFAFAWSLSTEEQFYLCLPVLVRLVPRRAMLALLLLAVIVIDQLAEHRMLAFILPPHGRGEIIVTSFVASIGFGALLAVLLDEPRAFRWLRPALGHAMSAPLLLGLVVLWLIEPPREFIGFEAALATFVAACAVGQDRLLPRVLSTSALGHIGRVSYGMYLFHVAIIGAIRAAVPSIATKAVLVFPIAFAISIGLATLSHRYFEAWFLSKRAGSREPGAQLGQVATTTSHARDNVQYADN